MVITKNSERKKYMKGVGLDVFDKHKLKIINQNFIFLKVQPIICKTEGYQLDSSSGHNLENTKY